MRQVIAKDILTRLAAGEITPESAYLDDVCADDAPICSVYEEGCKVCALGAAALSVLCMQSPDTTIDEADYMISNDKARIAELLEIFPNSLLDQIESLFECSIEFSQEWNGKPFFGERYILDEDWQAMLPEERMKAIWEAVAEDGNVDSILADLTTA